jgi:hypothetical protein
MASSASEREKLVASASEQTRQITQLFSHGLPDEAIEPSRGLAGWENQHNVRISYTGFHYGLWRCLPNRARNTAG